MLKLKVKETILRSFISQGYEDHKFIGAFIDSRLTLTQRVIDTLDPEAAIEVIRTLTEVTCLPDLVRDIGDFRASIRAAIRGLWSGELSRFEFVDTMNSTLTRNLRQAWHEGAAQCGIQPEELTGEERRARDTLINTQIGFTLSFADAIVDGSKENGGLLEPLLGRGEMWVNRWNEALTRGAAMACADEKRIWVLGPTEEHCKSCGGFEGRVYRFSVWLANNALPQNSNLSCGGFRCKCSLDSTTSRITPGKFPARLLG